MRVIVFNLYNLPSGLQSVLRLTNAASVDMRGIHSIKVYNIVEQRQVRSRIAAACSTQALHDVGHALYPSYALSNGDLPRFPMCLLRAVVLHLWWQFVLTEEDIVDVEGVGYEPVGEFTVRGRQLTPRDSPVVTRLLEAACLCNNATLNDNAEDGDGAQR